MDGAAPEPAVSGAVPGMNRPVALYFIVFYFLTCICLLGVIYTCMDTCLHEYIHTYIHTYKYHQNIIYEITCTSL